MEFETFGERKKEQTNQFWDNENLPRICSSSNGVVMTSWIIFSLYQPNEKRARPNGMLFYQNIIQTQFVLVRLKCQFTQTYKKLQ